MIGIRLGEKLHEVLVSLDDARKTLEFDDDFVVQPDLRWWGGEDELKSPGGKPCGTDFVYSSDSNTHWMSVEDIRIVVDEFCKSYGIKWSPDG